MKWKQMTGPERYRVVEMALRGEKSLKEISETFGVSRQVLSKAMEKVSQAAMEALEPKKSGRKGKSEEEKKLAELSQRASSLEKDVKHWKTRFEVAQAFIELTREQERRERTEGKKKKRRKTGQGPAGRADRSGQATRLAPVDDGRGAGHPEGEPGEVDKKE
jgi:transposase